MSEKINIAACVTNTRSEGPGKRFAIWVQGCSILCPGCCNPEMQDFNKGVSYTIDGLLHQVISSGNDGITFLGGEPFDQMPAAGMLAKAVREAGIGVMVFTGYTQSQLKCKPGSELLLENTDLLKAGPYVKALHSMKRRWIGSENQALYFLTDLYKEHPDVTDDYLQSVTIDLSGDEAVISGWPDLLGR